MKKILSSCTALTAVAAILLQPVAAIAQTTTLVSAQPATSDSAVNQYFVPVAGNPNLSYAQMQLLVRAKIKYVFVLFNENRSFDSTFGTFPGVNGLYSDGTASRVAPGSTQTYTDRFNNATVTVSPFLIGPQQNATVMDSVDHSHAGLAFKLDVVNGVAKMDKFAQDEYDRQAGGHLSSNVPPTAAVNGKANGFAKLVMAHVDCNTIPFFWQYANRFTIFDNIFATEDTPSSPNAVAMLAGQAGETQWVKHGSANQTNIALTGTINSYSSGALPFGPGSKVDTTVQTPTSSVTYPGAQATGSALGVPMYNDPQPFDGSEFDPNKRVPYSPTESYSTGNVSVNLTSATVPLTLAGGNVTAMMNYSGNTADIADVSQDIPYIAGLGRPTTAWRWYENGYGLEPYDSNGIASHYGYVSHHNGAQYFGYIANNPNENVNLKAEGDFFTDIQNGNLPSNGGVFYIRGGYKNLEGLVTPIQNPNYPPLSGGLTSADITKIKQTKQGDDDHPSYSDRQISEAMNAKVINAIASNPAIWSQSAIIMTYDESDGFYDHVPPRILSYGPDGLPQSRGIRVPMIVISPYSRVHTVSHAEGDHNSVIETINAIFNAPPLSSLPDEAQALAAGAAGGPTGPFNQYAQTLAPGFTQNYLGPRDTNSPTTDSLLSAFDPQRLTGRKPTLPGAYAMIDETRRTTLPHDGGNGCNVIGVTPITAASAGASETPPTNFNALPSTLPAAYNP